LARTGDRIVAVQAQGADLHQEITGSRLVVLPNAGHMLHHAEPDEVVSAIDWVSASGRAGGAFRHAASAADGA
jgi:pimeloyl-ACP methyl ester carboxylesterase